MTLKERFFKYIAIDTQSSPDAETFPSTEKQKSLSRLLVEELKAMGVENAAMDEFGYVMATIPWTKKEAVVKLRGTGIIDDLHHVLDGVGYRLETHLNREKRYAWSVAYTQE